MLLAVHLVLLKTLSIVEGSHSRLIRKYAGYDLSYVVLDVGRTRGALGIVENGQ